MYKRTERKKEKRVIYERQHEFGTAANVTYFTKENIIYCMLQSVQVH